MGPVRKQPDINPFKTEFRHQIEGIIVWKQGKAEVGAGEFER